MFSGEGFRTAAVLAVLLAAPTDTSAFEERQETELIVEGRFPFEPQIDSISYLHDAILFSGFGSLWIVNHPDLLRMDPRDFHVTARVSLPGLRGPIRLAEVGGEAIWIADTGTGTIYKIDPDSESVALTFRAMMNARDSHLGFGHGSLWVVTDGGRGDNVLTRFNAETGAVEAAIALPTHSMGGAHYAFDSVWVVGTRRNELYRIDPATNAIVSTTALERDPAYVISAEGSVWVNSRSGFVQRIDPVTGEVIARIETTYQGVDQLTAGGGFIWLGTSFAAVTQIDPTTNTIRRAWIGDQLQSTPDLLYAFGALWTYESPKAFLRITPPE